MSEDIVIPLENEKVYFTPGFFDRCTYMVEGKQTGEVSLVTPDGKPYVTMDFDAPLFAIWSPEGKDAPFVCIEPWYGRCDADDFDGTLEERAYENAVEPEQIFEASYSIRYTVGNQSCARTKLFFCPIRQIFHRHNRAANCDIHLKNQMTVPKRAVICTLYIGELEREEIL